MFALVWQGFPFFAIMILAGLQTVPEELYEAAEIDGATPWKQFVHITLPSIAGIVATAVLLRVIWIFNFPDIIYAMTGGGPANQTQIATTWMIQFTQQGDYGLASALGFIVMGVRRLASGRYIGGTEWERQFGMRATA